jgi:hypothetical protein
MNRKLFTLLLILVVFIGSDLFSAPKDLQWKSNVVLPRGNRKAAKTAILIIAPTKLGSSLLEQRWKLGKKVWEQYMHSHPNIDCYFLERAPTQKNAIDAVWVEKDTIYVSCERYGQQHGDYLLHKTIKAVEFLLPNYTHFIRTNLNTFIDLSKVNDYMETHHDSMYTTPLWENSWYTIGYSIFFTADVAAHMVNEYNRLYELNEKLLYPNEADDAILTSLATGIWPYSQEHPFRCCPSLPIGVRQLMSQDSLRAKHGRFTKYGLLLTPLESVDQAIAFSKKASPTTMLYRQRDGLGIQDLAKLYEHLLAKHYPEFSQIDLQEYVRSLEKVR